MKILRKILSIIVILIAWYFLSLGIASILGTLSMLVAVKPQVPLWDINWINVLADPVLIIGLLLMLIGVTIWNWRQWQIIIGIVMLVMGIDTCVRALSVLHAPGPSSEFFNAPTFLIGYMFLTPILIVLGVFFIRNYKRLSRSYSTD